MQREGIIHHLHGTSSPEDKLIIQIKKNEQLSLFYLQNTWCLLIQVSVICNCGDLCGNL